MQLVFELADGSLASGTLVVHQCVAHAPPHPLPHAARTHELAHTAPVPTSTSGRPAAAYVRPAAGRGATLLSQQLSSLEGPSALRDAVLPSGADAPASDPLPAIAMLHMAAQKAGGLMQPQGDNSQNDSTWAKRIINVATALPFLAVGANMLRTHRTPEGRRYAASVLAVGTMASLYHATWGNARTFMRKMDYWTISASTTFLMKAVWPDKPLLHRCFNVAALATPFRPFVLSTAQTMVMQAEFARQAVAHKSVRPHFYGHMAAAVAGLAAFAVEDHVAESGFEYVHAAWHCLAAYGVVTTGALVAHKERLRLSNVANFRSVHDSAASLDSLDVGGGKC